MVEKKPVRMSPRRGIAVDISFDSVGVVSVVASVSVSLGVSASESGSLGVSASVLVSLGVSASVSASLEVSVSFSRSVSVGSVSVVEGSSVSSSVSLNHKAKVGYVILFQLYPNHTSLGG